MNKPAISAVILFTAIWCCQRPGGGKDGIHPRPPHEEETSEESGRGTEAPPISGIPSGIADQVLAMRALAQRQDWETFGKEYCRDSVRVIKEWCGDEPETSFVRRTDREAMYAELFIDFDSSSVSMIELGEGSLALQFWPSTMNFRSQPLEFVSHEGGLVLDRKYDIFIGMGQVTVVYFSKKGDRYYITRSERSQC